jgi:hypothetical protein
MIAGQLSLFDEPPADDPRRSSGHAFAHGGDGPIRLLRALVRRGLEEDSQPVAALLVLELDEEAPTT